ncbi:interferon regulatory factor 10 isoform X1 [Periophthalmus magnuspinnatus]|uniref:interferon regulatory factor 10 isoform X1 n=1 Tax=Periophthalmus magnuspinnatus TaxID=409849 RepID=UPI00243647E3|nr:interferon regulatory factor 10 isoform X1 [Periophthalmus magnuspinnatus]
MEERAKLHLKEWLIAQIESGQYEGLCWEDEHKTMFRIPWKHAAKKDYKQTEDAALFKAWAVYKGKYREGRDRADPTMWKTRLRCALNKSTDFDEVPDRNQLDITEPYKVYRIQEETGSEPKDPVKMVNPKRVAMLDPQETKHPKLELENISQDFSTNMLHHQRESIQKLPKQRPLKTDDPMREHMYCEVKENNTSSNPPHPPVLFLNSAGVSDFRMQVTLLYQGVKVMQVTTESPDGCFILQGRVPLGNEQIYGTCTAEQLPFPSPTLLPLPVGMAETMARLLCHLERGVLVWVAPEGVFIKRFCQGRVYWNGPQAPHTDLPNKLDRDKTFKLLDVPVFLSQLQRCVQGKGPAPLYKIELCFGEEYPDPSVPKMKKLIMAEVVPVFAEKLLSQFQEEEEEAEERATEDKPDPSATSG